MYRLDLRDLPCYFIYLLVGCANSLIVTSFILVETNQMIAKAKNKNAKQCYVFVLSVARTECVPLDVAARTNRPIRKLESVNTK